MDKHLTDDQLIQYINKINEISIDDLRMIEAHLYIHKCVICKSRLVEIEQLNKRLNTQGDIEENEVFSVCEQSDLVYEYISGKMVNQKKEMFTNHMAICDECRELSAILMQSSINVQNKQQSFNKWEKIKSGLYRLLEPVLLYKENNESININLNTMAFRDNGEVLQKESITLDLPESNDKLRIKFNQNVKSNQKIVIELIKSSGIDTLIEVYDAEGNLLKSEEDSTMISCSIKSPTGLICINKKYEVTFKLP